MTSGNEVNVNEETRDYSYIREVVTDKMRNTFIRLVRPADGAVVADSYSFDGEGIDITIDRDSSGHLMGVTITEWDNSDDDCENRHGNRGRDESQ